MAKGSFYSFLGDRNIKVLISCRIIWGLTQSIFTPYFSLFALAQEGITPELLGLVISMKALGTALLAPIGGYLADSIGRKKMILVGTSLHSISYLFYLVAVDFKMILVGSLVEGLSIIHFPALQAITQDSLLRKRRGLGLSATTGLQALPSLVSPFVGGVLAADFGIDTGMRFGFALAFLAGMTVAMIRWKYLEETLIKNTTTGKSRDLIALLKKAYSGIFLLLREYRSLRGLAALAIVDTFFSAITSPFWIVYATTVVGIGPLEWGTIEIAGSAFRIAILLFSGNFVDRFGSKKVLLINLATAPFVNLLFIFCQDFSHLFLFRVLIAIQTAFTLPAASALLADIVPRENRGRAIAAIGWQPVIISLGTTSSGFFRFLPYFGGSILSGYIFSWNVRLPWLFLVGSYVLGFFVCLLLIEQPKKH